MREYPEPDGQYIIRDRGRVFTYIAQDQPALGDVVLVAGRRYRVKGVETFCVPRRNQLRNFGILVQPLTEH